MNRRYSLLIVLLGTLLVAGSTLLGAEPIDPRALWRSEGMYAVDHMILLRLRIPRVLTGFLAGGALALCGMVFQALFRNPLATPYTLGVSSGASLGAVVSLTVMTGQGVGRWLAPTVPWALTGAVAVVLVVFFLAGRSRQLAGNTLLLAGVAINLFCASLILLLQYLGNRTETFQVVRWMMGSLSGSGYPGVTGLLLFFVPGAWLVWRFRHELDMLLSGNDLAITRGVNLKRMVPVLYFSLSLLTGMTVAFCGPIGFVGIMVPHLCRRLFSSRHDRLLLPVIFCGGVLLVVCDTVARVMLAPAEVPVGIIMALLGGPFFLFVLLHRTQTEGL
jgi:iron complex transport system permease protein